MRNQEKIFVIGHKNPDTDSICSAIAYADIKKQDFSEGEIHSKNVQDRSMKRQNMC